MDKYQIDVIRALLLKNNATIMPLELCSIYDPDGRKLKNILVNANCIVADTKDGLELNLVLLKKLSDSLS